MLFKPSQGNPGLELRTWGQQTVTDSTVEVEEAMGGDWGWHIRQVRNDGGRQMHIETEQQDCMRGPGWGAALESRCY